MNKRMDGDLLDSRLNAVMDAVPDRYDALLKARYIDHQTCLTSTQKAGLNEAHAFLQGALSMMN